MLPSLSRKYRIFNQRVCLLFIRPQVLKSWIALSNFWTTGAWVIFYCVLKVHWITSFWRVQRLNKLALPFCFNFEKVKTGLSAQHWWNELNQNFKQLKFVFNVILTSAYTSGTGCMQWCDTLSTSVFVLGKTTNYKRLVWSKQKLEKKAINRTVIARSWRSLTNEAYVDSHEYMYLSDIPWQWKQSQSREIWTRVVDTICDVEPTLI